jgi:rhodanese-related sulfurtransferase
MGGVHSSACGDGFEDGFSNRNKRNGRVMTMSRFGRLFLITLVLMGLLLSTTAVVTGCGDTTTTTGTTTTAADNSVVLGDRALQTFASTPTSGEYANNTISGTELAAKLADPAEATKLFVLDVRKKADFDKGHIQGATNIEFAQWAAPDNLNMLPKDKKIVVVCYTGNTAAQEMMGLRMLGFDAAVLKGGMNGWAANQTQSTVEQDLANTNYPLVTTPAASSAPAPPSTSFTLPSDANYQILADEANSFMSAMPTSGDYANFTVSAATLNEKLTGSEKDQLFVLDIRKTDDFNKGHIEGATHVDFLAVAVPDNLKLLPMDKKIVVVCYTGNTAAQATTVLNMLGYDTVVLKYGMMGWAGNGKDAYLQEINSANNPVVTS